ncbi:MAG: histidine kinase [Alphaproteobacteria bacterium]|mgnify:CR=1 FL=1|jgi:small ligand-binding sensory domain FIST|nr:histidine kinase [Alphaproteobacteria bacterium]
MSDATPFPFAWSEADNAAVAARAVAQELVGQMRQGPRPKLGLLYISDLFADDMDAVVEILSSATGVAEWTGAAALGVIAGRKELFESPALAVMLLDLPDDAVQPYGPITDAASFEVAVEQAASFSEDAGAALGIIHMDPTGDPLGQGLGSLPGMLADAGGLYLVGGLASGRDAMPIAATAGLAARAVGGALVALESGVATGVSQGCRPIGPARTITVEGDGVIGRMDDTPAMSVLLAELGLSAEPDVADLREALRDIHIALPIAGADREDYLVRNLTGIDVQRGLVGISEAVADGDRAMFCRRDRTSAAEDLNRMAKDARRRLGRPPRGALYVSCLARGPNLFGPGDQELAILHAAIGGDCPVVGFFANGEIAHDRIYGYTGVLTLFG